MERRVGKEEKMGRKNRNARRRNRKAMAYQAMTSINMDTMMEGTVNEMREHTQAEQLRMDSMIQNNSQGDVALIGVDMASADPTGIEQNIMAIPLEKIITEKYQRALNMKNVNAIARNFNPARLGVLVVSKRGDGTFAVLDGQHRLAALRRLGMKSANCIVLEGMTLQDEAEYFRHQNENKQALRITDTFNAALWAGDEESIEINGLMQKYGFRFGKSGSPMCICAIGALQTILRTFGKDVLEYTLSSIALTYPKDATILRREMLAGMAEFWSHFKTRISVQQFAKRMMCRIPTDMYQELRLRMKGKTNPSTAFQKTVRFTCCNVLADNYNKGLRHESENRLTAEWNEEDA